MELPEQLAQALAAADEEYLTALCNRGIFHRAQKDLAAQENGISAAPSPGGAVYVKCSGVTCRICAPLGQSSCSCPSPSMCRHRITAMLWLQAHALPAAQGTAASISAASGLKCCARAFPLCCQAAKLIPRGPHGGFSKGFCNSQDMSCPNVSRRMRYSSGAACQWCCARLLSALR